MKRRANRRRARSAARRYRRNGLAIASQLKGVTAAFDGKLMMKAGALVGASVLNGLATNYLAEKIPVSAVKSGIGKSVLGLATAGMLFGISRMVYKPASNSILFGGVLDVVSKAFDKYVGGALPKPARVGEMLGDFLGTSDDMAGFGDDLGDYLTVANAAEARKLNGFGACGEGAVSEELACV